MAKQTVSNIRKLRDKKIVHIVNNGYFILFALHIYICVIRTFSLSGQIPAPSNLEKQEWSVPVYKTLFSGGKDAANNRKFLVFNSIGYFDLYLTVF